MPNCLNFNALSIGDKFYYVSDEIIEFVVETISEEPPYTFINNIKLLNDFSYGNGYYTTLSNAQDVLSERIRTKNYINGLIIKNTNIFNDFPKQGIIYEDLSPLFSNPIDLEKVLDVLDSFNAPYDKIVGLESRGFILASVLSNITRKPFIMVRKKGKLPGDVYSTDYELEYGNATLQIQKGVINTGDKILIIDDVLATGGSALAATHLVEMSGGEVINYNFISIVPGLEGLEKLNKIAKVVYGK